MHINLRSLLAVPFVQVILIFVFLTFGGRVKEVQVV